METVADVMGQKTSLVSIGFILYPKLVPQSDGIVDKFLFFSTFEHWFQYSKGGMYALCEERGNFYGILLCLLEKGRLEMGFEPSKYFSSLRC